MSQMDRDERTAFRRWVAGMTVIGNRSRSIEEWMKVWVSEKPRWGGKSSENFGTVRGDLGLSRRNETSDIVLNERQKQWFIDVYTSLSKFQIKGLLKELDFVICLHDETREVKIAGASIEGQVFCHSPEELQCVAAFLHSLQVITIIVGELNLADHDLVVKIQNTDGALKKAIELASQSRCSLVVAPSVQPYLKRLHVLASKAFTTHVPTLETLSPRPVFLVLTAEVPTGTVLHEMLESVKSILSSIGRNKWIARPTVIARMWGPEKQYKTREHVAGTLKDIFYRKTTSKGITEQSSGLLFRERGGNIHVRFN